MCVCVCELTGVLLIFGFLIWVLVTSVIMIIMHTISVCIYFETKRILNICEKKQVHILQQYIYHESIFVEKYMAVQNNARQNIHSNSVNNG